MCRGFTHGGGLTCKGVASVEGISVKGSHLCGVASVGVMPVEGLLLWG